MVIRHNHKSSPHNMNCCSRRHIKFHTWIRAALEIFENLDFSCGELFFPLSDAQFLYSV